MRWSAGNEVTKPRTPAKLIYINYINLMLQSGNTSGAGWEKPGPLSANQTFAQPSADSMMSRAMAIA